MRPGAALNSLLSGRFVCHVFWKQGNRENCQQVRFESKKRASTKRFTGEIKRERQSTELFTAKITFKTLSTAVHSKTGGKARFFTGFSENGAFLSRALRFPAASPYPFPFHSPFPYPFPYPYPYPYPYPFPYPFLGFTWVSFGLWLGFSWVLVGLEFGYGLVFVWFTQKQSPQTQLSGGKVLFLQAFRENPWQKAYRRAAVMMAIL